MKSRLNCYFEPKLADQLTTFALRQGIHRSQLVEAAVMAFLSPDALDRREAAFIRRLDRLSRQMERIERDLAIAIEVQAQFVRFWLSASPPIPPDHQEAAKARGASRYQSFIETLGRRLQRGDSLVREISREIWPERYDSADAVPTARDPDRYDMPDPDQADPSTSMTTNWAGSAAPNAAGTDFARAGEDLAGTEGSHVDL
ncbi:hypothetical protein ACMV_26040 [Acidiphilium multivorum AIU301]|uniref:Uncharacterized protein n=1 Tax=Acidiphilium multivorum (strain DSM 11245 / JCM 8867 / NBRC 100883 / AIU 301) TaxID=926570 RepID=F0J2K7_ACIMA|nr:hypothetical protein [Acidiphilium multivorum]BAJ81951.1 hypothetical protein ACMV_26040 [Acidiphilium multivorum AIU301]GAN75103.1 DNA-binding helix-turn-helix protein CopG [Acidiphilium multivorum AIU301]